MAGVCLCVGKNAGNCKTSISLVHRTATTTASSPCCVKIGPTLLCHRRQMRERKFVSWEFIEGNCAGED